MVGVAKRPKAPDCGSGIRGFESHHPPHKNRGCRKVSSVFIWVFGVMGFEEDGRPTGGKKHAGGMFFSPGENPITDP